MIQETRRGLCRTDVSDTFCCPHPKKLVLSISLKENPHAFHYEQTTHHNKEKNGEVLVIPIIWPCENDLGVVKDYWDDQKSADQSAFAFARMFQKFMAWRSSADSNPEDDPCLKRINVLAHSMGNRVLRETLSNWHKYD